MVFSSLNAYENTLLLRLAFGGAHASSDPFRRDFADGGKRHPGFPRSRRVNGRKKRTSSRRRARLCNRVTRIRLFVSTSRTPDDDGRVGVSGTHARASVATTIFKRSTSCQIRARAPIVVIDGHYRTINIIYMNTARGLEPERLYARFRRRRACVGIA